MIPKVEPDTFLACGMLIIKRGRDPQASDRRSFRSIFGTTPEIASILWSMMAKTPKGQLEQLLPNHLLWTLMFMYLYTFEKPLSSMAECDPKTFRRWIWITLRIIMECKDKLVS